MSSEPPVRLEVELTDAQAWNLAQFVKRVGFSDVRTNAVDKDEAYAMLEAIDVLAKALRDAGYAPR
jgi:hypothetical protein